MHLIERFVIDHKLRSLFLYERLRRKVRSGHDEFNYDVKTGS